MALVTAAQNFSTSALWEAAPLPTHPAEAIMTDDRFFDDARREFYYGRDAWRGYLEGERDNEHELDLPDPAEIMAEMAAIRWLRDQRFPDRFVRAVIVHRSPRIDLVRRVARKYGSEQAYKILRRFCIEDD